MPALTPVTQTAPRAFPVTAADLFGTRTGMHSHPVTHPLQVKFTDGDCPVCDPQREAQAPRERLTASDVIRAVLAGVAIGLFIIAAVPALRPVHSPALVVVPSIFTPAPQAPHCTTAALSPSPLHGRPECKEAP